MKDFTQLLVHFCENLPLQPFVYVAREDVEGWIKKC